VGAQQGVPEQEPHVGPVIAPLAALLWRRASTRPARAVAGPVTQDWVLTGP
jgi:hypothetical protein